MAVIGISELSLCGISLLVLWVLGNAAYNVFFHPLRSFPGPILFSISRLPFCYRLLRGTLALDMLSMYEKYGDIVRVAPNELAMADPRGWNDIMGHRKSGDEMGKSDNLYRPLKYVPTSFANAGREEHARLRRQLSHGFSEKSMREQEPLIKSYIDCLIQRLHENCKGGRATLDVVNWYCYTTFDIIGDLVFGESFGCLERSKLHSWIEMLFDSLKLAVMFQAISYYPRLRNLLLNFIPMSNRKKRKAQAAIVRAKVKRRMKCRTERPDLIEGLLKKKEEWGMSMDDLISNGHALLLGGSETTATLLSGITYLLLTNQSALKQLSREVRSSFKDEDEITITSVGTLTYMVACLNEAMRIYPPVATGLPRKVPKGGALIGDAFVPEDTTVAMYHWALYHLEINFALPFEYHPERFLGDERFEKDRREIFQPFHVGPRNCLGRNLAYAEMRLILARIIYNFDMELADVPENYDWMKKQRVYNFWEKGPLYVHLKPVRDATSN